MYLGSTLRSGDGARTAPGPECSRSANQTIQLPENDVTFGIWMASV